MTVPLHGCEKFESILGCNSFLTEEFVSLSITFSNQFNVLFYDGGVFFICMNHRKEITKNVYLDLQVHSFIKAIELQSLFINSPCFFVVLTLESKVYVLDLNKFHQKIEVILNDSYSLHLLYREDFAFFEKYLIAKNKSMINLTIYHF